MGVIQNAVNSSLSGTAFILKQSGVLDDRIETRKKNKAGEKEINRLEHENVYVKNGLQAHINENPDDVNNPLYEEAINNVDEDYKKKIADVKEKTPEYRDAQLQEKALKDVKGKITDASIAEMVEHHEEAEKEYADYAMREGKEKAKKRHEAQAAEYWAHMKDSLRRAAETKANSEKVKNRIRDDLFNEVMYGGRT